MRQGAAGQGNGAGGDFPDFGRWYDMYRGRTGKPFKRARAEQLWLLLRMTVTERRQLWRFTDLRLRRYSAEHPAPNPFAFLEHVWMRNLRQIRASHRKGDPFTVAELLAATMGQQLEGRA